MPTAAAGKAIDLLERTGLYRPVRRLAIPSIIYASRARDRVTRHSQHAIDRYLRTHDVPKVQLGCGMNYLNDWLNTDLVPNANRVGLDVTRLFPLPDNSFDFIFSEHVIEHLPYAAGQVMLAECQRVLKPGGVLRIATPDLRFVIGLYQHPDGAMQSAYVEWSSNEFIGKKAPHDAVSVVNNYVRDWGHQYIYDVASMTKAMESAGLTGVVEASINQSQHPALRDLENESRQPAGFLKLESMLLEARKP